MFKVFKISFFAVAINFEILGLIMHNIMHLSWRHIQKRENILCRCVAKGYNNVNYLKQVYGNFYLL